MAAKQTQSATEEPKPKSNGGLFGLIGVAAAALTASFASTYFLGGGGSPAGVVCGEASSETPQALITPLVHEDQEFVEIEEILITIGNEPATRYLKMRLAIVTRKDGVRVVKRAEPLLIDAFVSYLRSREISDFENADFFPRMRSDLANRADLVLGGAVSDGVLIVEFLLR